MFVETRRKKTTRNPCECAGVLVVEKDEKCKEKKPNQKKTTKPKKKKKTEKKKGRRRSQESTHRMVRQDERVRLQCVSPCRGRCCKRLQEELEHPHLSLESNREAATTCFGKAFVGRDVDAHARQQGEEEEEDEQD